jgi:hypothetical protein
MQDEPRIEKSHTGDLLVAAAIGFAGVCAIQWILSHPDNIRTIHMRCALEIQKLAHKQADHWRIVADRAGTYYNQVRNVSV